MQIEKTYSCGVKVVIQKEDPFDALKELAQADDLFFNTTAYTKGDDGSVVTSDKVVWVYRSTGDYEFVEQVCKEGMKHPLGGFKRPVGRSKDGKSVYVKKYIGDNDLNQNEVAGLAGWRKYVKPDGGYGNNGNYNGGQTNQAAPPPQQQQAAPPPGSEQSYDDIPF